MLSIEEIRKRLEQILPALAEDRLPVALPPGADESPFVARLRGIPNIEVCRNSEKLDICPFFIEAESLEGPTAVVRGRSVIMLGSNNYLGLTRHPEVMQAARDALEKYGTSCTGSRFLNGTIPLHTTFEEEIADFLGYPKAILYTTGFMANQGALSALVRRGDAVYSDRDNHASIVEGLLGHGLQLNRYCHSDIDDLASQLSRADSNRTKLVISDSVFSMTGDVIDLPKLMTVARRHGAYVYLDEAHGIGALGAGGRGAVEHFGLRDKPDIVMGTLSKSLASVGGFICGPAEVIDFLRFCSRPFVFSASGAPAVTAAGLAALRVLKREPERVAKTRENAKYLADGLRNLGYTCSSGATPIVSIRASDVLVGCLLHLSLVEYGVLTNMVMYPAVPKGEGLLRASVMATHTREHLDQALEIFGKVGRKIGVI